MLMVYQKRINIFDVYVWDNIQNNTISNNYNNDLFNNNVINSVNYPYFAHRLCKKVSNNTKNIGILVCGSGMGMSMAANRHKKIRAAVCYSVKNTKLSRLHNNANIITLGSRLTKKNTAFKCIETFVNTKFEGGRHTKRIKKI